jgi:hypothetical protein
VSWTSNKRPGWEVVDFSRSLAGYSHAPSDWLVKGQQPLFLTDHFYVPISPRRVDSKRDGRPKVHAAFVGGLGVGRQEGRRGGGGGVVEWWSGGVGAGGGVEAISGEARDTGLLWFWHQLTSIRA